jgi:N-acetyl-anhydromuramyl-L-alanine amidase AmpD
MGHRRAGAGLVAVVLLAACQQGPSLLPSGRQLASGLGLTTAAVAMPPIAAEVWSPNVEARPHPAIRCIVLHHTASTQDAMATAKFFASPKAKVSAHYIVDRSGAIVRCVPDAKLAHHAGVSEFGGKTDVNQFSLGIEIANVGDSVEPYPKAQVDAVVRLTAALASTHKVPLAGITRHRDIARPLGRKSDTSDNFSLAYVHKAVQALMSGRQPAVYQADAVPAGYAINEQFRRVEAGDTWESLAEAVYDAEAMAGALRRLNPGVTLRPGAVVRLPLTYSLVAWGAGIG